MADRIKNYQQEADQISTLKAIRTDFGVTPSSYTPDSTVVTKDRVVTFSQAEEELVVLGDIEKGVKQQVVKGDIADKRITNIEKLLQGNLYDYQTDNSSAYTKSVPAGAMPYAGLESLGGKTVVWNQLQNHTQPSVTSHDVVFTNNGDGSWTITGTNDGVSYSGVNLDNVSTIAGHKYFIGGINGGQTDFVFRCFFGTTFNVDTTDIIYTETISTTAHIQLMVSVGGVVNKTVYPQIIDLTLLYGAGNEPSTVAEFEAMFPAEWYAFNVGTLLSAGVTEVESVGKNFADYSGGQGYPSSTAMVNTAKRIFEVGKYVVGLTTNNYYDPSQITNLTVGENNISFTPTQGAYGIGIPFNCIGGTTYTFSAKTIYTIGVAWYKADGTHIIDKQSVGSTMTDTAPADAVQGVYIVRASAVNTPANYQDIQAEVGTTATEYSAPFTISTPIPASIQALEGYGWSAGTVYNYIDYERKVFVQHVGSRAYASGDESDSTVVTDMTTTYYPLNPAVETDISAYLTDDNLIEVEAGGTLTFPNSNGTDYQIPVPSEEEYMIDLQASL